MLGGSGVEPAASSRAVHWIETEPHDLPPLRNRNTFGIGCGAIRGGGQRTYDQEDFGEDTEEGGGVQVAGRFV